MTRNTLTTRQSCSIAAAAVALCLLSACGGPKNFVNENDKLRARVLELETEIKSLQTRAESAEKQLKIEKSRLSGTAAELPEGLYTPAVTRIAIAGGSRGVDTDKDGRDDAVRLYVQTLDRRDRFLPAVGEVEVTLAAVPAGGSAVTVATASFNASQFDEAYRSGLGGTHYTLIVPFAEPVPKGIESLTATVRVKDLLTGESHEAGKRVNIANPAAVQ